MIEQLETLKLTSHSIHYQQLRDAEVKEERQQQKVGAPGSSLFSPNVRDFRVEGLDPSIRPSRRSSDEAVEQMVPRKSNDLEEEKDPSLMISELPTFTSSAAMKDAATIAREVQAFMVKTLITPPGSIKNKGKNSKDF